MKSFVTIIPGTDTKHAIVARVVRTDLKAIYIEPYVDGPILGFDRVHGKQWGLWPSEEAARGWHVAENDMLSYRHAHDFVLEIPSDRFRAIEHADAEIVTKLTNFVNDWLSSHGHPRLEQDVPRPDPRPVLRIGFVVLDPADMEPKVIVPPPDKPGTVYCDDGDLDSFMGEGAPVFPAEVKADARVYASRVIDSYLREHVQLPLRSWGGALRSICAAIAGLHMFVARTVVAMPDQVWLTYADALRMLRQCATGNVHLTLEGSDGKRFPNIKPSATPTSIAEIAAQMEAEAQRKDPAGHEVDPAAPMLFRLIVPQGADVDVDALVKAISVVLSHVGKEAPQSA